MTDAPPVRVGSLGLGRWGGVLAGRVEKAGAEIVACFSPTESRRSEFATAHNCRPFDSLEELIASPDVEALVVATPHSTHGDIIRLAAAHGKHVFVDKPLTADLGDATSAVSAAEQAGIILQVGHQRRRLGAVRRLKEMRSAGELGDVQLYEAQQSAASGLSMPASSWRADPSESPLGAMASHGIHMVDTLIFLEGPVARVSAFARPGGERSSIDLGTAILLEFTTGALGSLLSSFFVPKSARVAVAGTEGVAVMDDDGASLTFTGVDGGEPRPVEFTAGDPILEQMSEFVNVVRDGGRPEVDGRQGLAAVAVLDAALRSSRSGEVIEIGVPVGS